MTSQLLSPELQQAVTEVMRRTQAGPNHPHELAERFCMLLRVIAITTAEPREAVIQVTEQLRPFTPESCVLDAVSARVLEVIGPEEKAVERVEGELMGLLDEVRESREEHAEQVSALISGGDCVMMLGAEEGGVLEKAVVEAADTVAYLEGAQKAIEVVVVRVMPDHKDVAGAMKRRLDAKQWLEASVVWDVEVTGRLARGGKVFLEAMAANVDEGGVCARGSAMMCAAANRMKVGVVMVVARHRLLADGGVGVEGMGEMGECPGKVWAYEEARDDVGHEAIAVVAGLYDVVALQRCEIVVTEFGGYAPDYVRRLTPRVGIVSVEGNMGGGEAAGAGPGVGGVVEGEMEGGVEGEVEGGMEGGVEV